ncbi:MAG: hypothetical protein ABW136_01395 [Steroidobacteraceae bacterium]
MNPSRVLSPDAEVHDDGVIWRGGPSLQISVPKAATYVGADRWVLFDVADAEVHLYVEADSSRRVQRYYWIQFESFLPSLPDKRYGPVNQPVATLAGLPFHVIARAGPSSEPARAGSDLEHVLRLFVKNSYTLPRELATVRLLHRRADARSEVMLIYGEDLGVSGTTLANVIGSTDYLPAWKPVAEAATQRALKQFTVKRVV